MAFKRVSARSALMAAALLATPSAFAADDAPVEKPAVDRPALPQPAPASPASPAKPAPTRASGQSEAAHGSKQTGNAGTGGAGRGGGRQPILLYFAAGPGLLWGLSGGPDFERTNPALTGSGGLEFALSRSTGLGFELNGDFELAAESDRGTYTALFLRARLGKMFTPRNRVWGAAGLGGAGYQTGSLAFSFAAGTSFMFVPKFGLDFSANLSALTATAGSNNPAIQDDYPGGAVLLFALRALFEVHR